MCGQVGVEHGAEGQAIVPAAAEVGNINVLLKNNTKVIHLNFDYTRQNIYNPDHKSIGSYFLGKVSNKTVQHSSFGPLHHERHRQTADLHIVSDNAIAHNQFCFHGTI